jgi:uncharacterized Fe-S cluster protein YjdI
LAGTENLPAIVCIIKKIQQCISYTLPGTTDCYLVTSKKMTMAKETFRYSNGEITVLWQPGLCTHSRRCWTELGQVFDPRKKPWVNMAGADTAAIVAQVSRCPSGALSIEKSKEPDAQPDTNAPAQVELLPNGPLLLKTGCQLQHPDGRVETITGPAALCRCGHSQRKPFCDGSHVAAGFSG